MKNRDRFDKLPDEKRDRITRIAAEEFSAKGYSKTSINAIVSRLGIAKGSIFQYFGDKQGLFYFVFNQAVEQVKSYLREARDESADADLFSRFETTVLAGMAFLRRHPLVYRLYLKALYEDDIPFRGDILTSLRRYSLKYFRRLLTDARQKGELRPDVNIDHAAFVMDALMDRFLQALTIEHMDGGVGLCEADEEQARVWVRSLADLMRRGLGASEVCCDGVSRYE